MRIVEHAETKKRRRRERALKSVAVLPALATLGNLVCGFGAIYMCLLAVLTGGSPFTTPETDKALLVSIFPSFQALAAYLLVLAMFFDAIDGRLARFTRKTSEFGGQLDSLADIVSFGVAPAVIVLSLVRPESLPDLTMWQRIYWRSEWVMAAIYVCCAALRLARFNVENVGDESAHMGFRGLPTPGAASALIGLIIFHQDLLPRDRLVSQVLINCMPPFAMLLGLLMVSRIPYVHLVNVLLRGRRPFPQIVVILIVFLVGMIVQPQLTIALAAVLYALSSPVAWWLQWLYPKASSSAQPGGLPSDNLPANSVKQLETAKDAPQDKNHDSMRSAG